MNKFNWENFKDGKIAIHCDTEEKAVDFINECVKRNIFLPGYKNKTDNSNWNMYKEYTVYYYSGIWHCILINTIYDIKRMETPIIEWDFRTIGISNKEVEELADHLVEHASYAFETQDRELLEKVLLDYIDMKLKGCK